LEFHAGAENSYAVPVLTCHTVFYLHMQYGITGRLGAQFCLTRGVDAFLKKTAIAYHQNLVRHREYNL